MGGGKKKRRERMQKLRPKANKEKAMMQADVQNTDRTR
jgi:hypothetical protein